MVQENKYRGDVMKKYFNKKLVISKKDNDDFENSTKYWICDRVCVEGGIKVRDHCHIAGRYRGSAHSDCNINVKLNHQIPIIFHNLKSYDSHAII